jgi:hypothetical protein
MADIIFILSTLVCFAVALLYVAACKRLNSRSSRD